MTFHTEGCDAKLRPQLTVAVRRLDSLQAAGCFPTGSFLSRHQQKPRNKSQIQINCPPPRPLSKGHRFFVSLMHSGKQPPTSTGLLYCFILSRRDVECPQPSVTRSGRFPIKHTRVSGADWSHDTKPETPCRPASSTTPSTAMVLLLCC